MALRTETEWVETGWNVVVGADAERIIAAVKGFQPADERSDLFGDGRAGQLIVTYLGDDRIPDQDLMGVSLV